MKKTHKKDTRMQYVILDHILYNVKNSIGSIDKTGMLDKCRGFILYFPDLITIQ